MDADTPIPAPDGSAPPPPESEVEPVFDGLLRSFVQAANQLGDTLGITLSIGGLLVSGTLTSYENYILGISDTLDAADAKRPGSSGEPVWRNSLTPMVEAEKASPRDPWFIHLRDAHFLMGGGQLIPQNQGVWWRGRLEEVDSWFFGVISVT